MDNYRARQLEIEAVQWDGINTQEIMLFAGIDNVLLARDGRVQVRTSEVWVELHHGFWAWRIKGGHEYYVSSNRGFETVFE